MQYRFPTATRQSVAVFHALEHPHRRQHQSVSGSRPREEGMHALAPSRSGITIAPSRRRPRRTLLAALALLAELALLAALTWLALAPGARPLHAQSPAADSIRTFRSTHTDSTRLYYTRVVTQPPRVDTLIDTLWCSATGCGPNPPALAAGVPFGIFALWNGGERLASPVDFTGSQDYTSPETVVATVANARAARHRLVLVLTGGNSADYITNGKFDLSKWKRR